MRSSVSHNEQFILVPRRLEYIEVGAGFGRLPDRCGAGGRHQTPPQPRVTRLGKPISKQCAQASQVHLPYRSTLLQILQIFHSLTTLKYRATCRLTLESNHLVFYFASTIDAKRLSELLPPPLYGFTNAALIYIPPKRVQRQQNLLDEI